MEKKNDNLDASTRIKESRLLAIPLIGVSTGILVLGLTFNFWYQYILNIIPVGLR